MNKIKTAPMNTRNRMYANHGNGEIAVDTRQIRDVCTISVSPSARGCLSVVKISETRTNAVEDKSIVRISEGSL